MFEVPNCASGTFWPGGVSSEQAVMASAHTCAPTTHAHPFSRHIRWINTAGSSIINNLSEFWGVQKAFVSLFGQTRGVFAHLFFIDTARFQATTTRRRPRHTQRIGKYPSLGFCSMLRLTIELELIRLKLATKRYRS